MTERKPDLGSVEVTATHTCGVCGVVVTENLESGFYDDPVIHPYDGWHHHYGPDGNRMCYCCPTCQPPDEGPWTRYE